MNLFQASDLYLNKISNSISRPLLNNDSDKSHIKVLLLDKYTTSIISMVTTQTELLAQEIYLVDTLENYSQRDSMRHLKCICYVKPCDETIEWLVKELQDPKYKEYQIFFNNIVSKLQLERLAESDDLEVVTRIEEIFQDYFIVNQTLFSLDYKNVDLFQSPSIWNQDFLKKVTQSLVSLLLSLKLKPYIQFEANSPLCFSLAKELDYELEKNRKSLFDFQKTDSTPILFLLDRKNDPLTPLLQPWTYQSMIHEYIGIKRNIVDLTNIPNLENELKQVVLSERHDSFFHDTMYLNFGDLSDKIKQYVSQYKDKTKINSSINNIDDIKKFIEKFPEFNKLSGNVSKHTTIVSELDRQLHLNGIWEVSELEQNLSIHEPDNDDFEELLKIFADKKFNSFYKLKLACIFLMKNQQSKIQQLESSLFQSLLPDEINIYYYFKSQCNLNQKDLSLHDNKDLISGLTKKFNKISNKNGADNVFMQHVPQLSQLLTELSKPHSKLDGKKYKGVGNIPYSGPVQDIVIFMVGGVTLEESRIVHQFNKNMEQQSSGLRVVIGSTNIINTHQYLDDIRLISSTAVNKGESS